MRKTRERAVSQQWRSSRPFSPILHVANEAVRQNRSRIPGNMVRSACIASTPLAKSKVAYKPILVVSAQPHSLLGCDVYISGQHSATKLVPCDGPGQRLAAICSEDLHSEAAHFNFYAVVQEAARTNKKQCSCRRGLYSHCRTRARDDF